jgi:hypothetical protein
VSLCDQRKQQQKPQHTATQLWDDLKKSGHGKLPFKKYRCCTDFYLDAFFRVRLENGMHVNAGQVNRVRRKVAFRYHLFDLSFVWA